MKKNNKNQKGAALIIYLLVMALFITVLMAATYSRLLLALKRGESTTDSLIASYAAEGQVNDVVARLSEELLKPPLSLNQNIPIGTTTLHVVGSQTGNVQKVVVTAQRPFASTQIEADRVVESLGTNSSADILLGLDCTGSMDTTDPLDKLSRIANLKAAALSFVGSIPQNGNFHLGVFVFGVDAKWLSTSYSSFGVPSGIDVTLQNKVPLTDIYNAINNDFADTWSGSKACGSIMNATSVGTAFTFAQDYFGNNKPALNTKQVEIVITDGDPNARIPYAGCSPSVYCPSNTNFCKSAYTGTYGSCMAGVSQGTCTPYGVQFLGCSVADRSTLYDGINKGVRDPNITAYAVTISTKANGDASTLLGKYLGDNYLPASRSSLLTGILSTILKDIIATRETVTIRKGIPGQ